MKRCAQEVSIKKKNREEQLKWKVIFISQLMTFISLKVFSSSHLTLNNDSHMWVNDWNLIMKFYITTNDEKTMSWKTFNDAKKWWRIHTIIFNDEKKISHFKEHFSSNAITILTLYSKAIESQSEPVSFPSFHFISFFFNLYSTNNSMISVNNVIKHSSIEFDLNYQIST